KGLAEANTQLFKVLLESCPFERDVAECKFVARDLLELPFTNQLPVQTHAHEVANENRRKQCAVRSDEHVVLATLDALEAREGKTACTGAGFRPDAHVANLVTN